MSRSPARFIRLWRGGTAPGVAGLLTTDQVVHGRYRCGTVLGQGQAGAVYQAYDERLGIDCVLKEVLPPPGLSPEEAHAQFWKQASILSNLRHPNLPRVTDYFLEDGAC